MAEADPSPLRNPTGIAGHVLAAYCAALSVLHLVVALQPGLISEFQRNVLHFAGFVLLAAVIYPPLARARHSAFWRWFDLAFGAAVALSAWWFVLNDTRLYGE